MKPNLNIPVRHHILSSHNLIFDSSLMHIYTYIYIHLAFYTFLHIYPPLSECIYTYTHTHIYIDINIYFTNIELLGVLFIFLRGKHYFLISHTTLKCLILYYKLSCTKKKLQFFMGVKHLFQCICWNGV